MSDSLPAAGRIEKIWIKRAHGGPMDAVPAGRLLAGRGVEGSADVGGKRQVTLLEKEVWERLMRALDADLDPAARRANILISGLALAESPGRVLRVGGSRVVIRGETKPCNLMEKTLPGLRQALYDGWRGGVFGEVLDDGPVAVGDAVTWEAD